MHDRYQVRHDFLTPELGDEIVSISRLVNAFFRWEFNSCETIVKDGVAYPIDYANASPDVALTSLHYYFPWAIMALVRWSAFCAITRREMLVNQNSRDYFEWGDRERSLLRGEARGLPPARRRLLPGRGLRGVLRHAPRAPAGARARVVHLRASSTTCSCRPCARRSRRTSRSTSSSTTAACSAPGRGTTARRRDNGDRRRRSRTGARPAARAARSSPPAGPSCRRRRRSASRTGGTRRPARRRSPAWRAPARRR